jgi:hypothetical protein
MRTIGEWWTCGMDDKEVNIFIFMVMLFIRFYRVFIPEFFLLYFFVACLFACSALFIFSYNKSAFVCVCVYAKYIFDSFCALL